MVCEVLLFFLKRNYDLSEDFLFVVLFMIFLVEFRMDIFRSNDDEGYNMFKNENLKEENFYVVLVDV